MVARTCKLGANAGSSLRRLLAKAGAGLRAWPLVAAVQLAVASAAAAQSGPIAQDSDTLFDRGGAPSIALYSTELDGGGVGRGTSLEMVDIVRSLPCPRTTYRFVATRASLDDSQASVYEATVRVLDARLPPHLSCGSPLPVSLRGISVTVRVTPTSGATILPARYSSERIVVESEKACVTLDSLCAGAYEITGVFQARGRPIRVGYLFTIKPRSLPTVFPAPAPVELCPIA